MRILIFILLSMILLSCKTQKESCDAYSQLETKKTIN